VDSDATARAAWKRVARGRSVVPVFQLGGHVLYGFDPKVITRLARR